MLNHDDGSSHAVMETMKVRQESSVKLVDHLPYKLLWPKKELRAQLFQIPEDTVSACKEPTVTYQKKPGISVSRSVLEYAAVHE